MEIMAFRVGDQADTCWWVSIFVHQYTCIFRGNVVAATATAAIRLALEHVDANPRERAPGVENLPQPKE